jgi:hypothetical protein
MEIEELDYAIQCRLPGERRYRGVLGLPVCMALIASYLQKDIPGHHLYMGEIDLLRKVRDVPDQILQDFCVDIQDGVVPKPVRVYGPPASAKLIQELLLDGVTAIACERLDDAVFRTWPELAPTSAR